MRKLLFIILPVVVLAAGVSGGWYWWNVLRFLQSTDDAYVQSDVSLISPKVEGYIKKVKVADNQEVAEGAVLFSSLSMTAISRPRSLRPRQPWRRAKHRSQPMRAGSSSSKR